MNEFTNQYTNFDVCFDEVIKYLNGLNINAKKIDTNIYFGYSFNNKDYIVDIVSPNKEKGYNIPYILVLPKEMKENTMMAVEVNNLEIENYEKLIMDGLKTSQDLTRILHEYDNPVLVPILPSVPGGRPYFQQLSRECFDVKKDNPYYRIDLQVLNIIKDAQEKCSKINSINEKIFLRGYSSSGVFAQRFSLCHYKIIDTLCIGGASGSIPMPTDILKYPLGVFDIEELTGNPFELDEFMKMKIRYCVGAQECINKTNTRLDEDGNYAPMHDMSYFDRSVPIEIGIQQRQIFGRNLFQRSQKQIDYMNQMGIDISQQIFEGRTHNNSSGHGVNELGDEFTRNVYEEAITKEKAL